jgi:hypothetical protein
MNEKIIPIEQAIEMRNEYHTHVKTSIESARGNGYQATEFAWIDLKTLKEYVELLEHVSKSNSENVSGVRIYFSAYPDSSTFAYDRTASINLPARETLFFAPTVKVSSTTFSNQYENLEHLPFCINPVNRTNPYEGNFEIIEDLLHSNDNPSTNKTNDYTNKTCLLLNKIGVTPPPY